LSEAADDPAAAAREEAGNGLPADGPAVIELRKHFDSTRWQVASEDAHLGSTFLITWTVEPEPVDAGIPPGIGTVLAKALCSVGPCWFPGDEGSGAPVATARLHRQLTWREALIFRADEGSQLLPAFESGAHDWSMAAQWIVVGASDDRSNDRMVAVLKTLLEEWKLPDVWPSHVSAIIQAGVDGDAAGCHCRTRGIEDQLRDALRRCATADGITVHAID
jgi:hypothetical protein